MANNQNETPSLTKNNQGTLKTDKIQLQGNKNRDIYHRAIDKLKQRQQ